MEHLTTAESLANWATGYQGGPLGIHAEALAHSGILETGGIQRTLANGSTWVSPREGGKAYRVTCSEITEGRYEEDGSTYSTRCGQGTHNGLPFCQAHARAYGVEEPEAMEALCHHGLSAWLCADPIAHYPAHL
jgi:hypothetical protein